MLRVRVPGQPRPYCAPQRNNKRFYSTHTPHIERLRIYFAEYEPITGPVALHFEFGLQMPQYVRKAMARKGVPHAIKKPDLSNFIKLAEDAAKGHLFEDDSKVVIITATKAYAQEPYTLIEVRPADCYPKNHNYPVPC